MSRIEKFHFSDASASEEEIRHGLEGNLCRCAGYHNIVRAVQAAARAGGMIPAAFEYERAGSVDEAVSLLGRDEDAKLLAGGHSLIPLVESGAASGAAMGCCPGWSE